MIKFIHAADIHLDSPLIGLENYEGAPVEEIRGAARKALSELVDLAVEEEVSFVIIAGDMYDGDWKDYNTVLFLLNKLSKLTSNGINVFIAKGNHDAESKITKNLKLPEGIKIFSSKHPETFYLKNLNIAIHGQSFSAPAVKENLASNYPQAEKSVFNVGVLHTSKIIWMSLKPYGQFIDKTINFDGRENFRIVYGHNESGKTTTLRAVKSLFFGIKKERTVDSFKFDGNKLRIFAKIENSSGESLVFQRRKGHLRTFLDENGNELDPLILKKFIFGIDESSFGSMFGFGMDDLVNGGKEIVLVSQIRPGDSTKETSQLTLSLQESKNIASLANKYVKLEDKILEISDAISKLNSKTFVPAYEKKLIQRRPYKRRALEKI